MRVAAAILIAVVVLTPTVGGQAPTVVPPQTGQTTPVPVGAISGTVLDGANGAALPDAIVTLSALPGTQMPAGYQSRQLTDARGRFAFANLPNDGTFQLTAAKYGYLDGGYGRDSAPTDPLRPVVIAGGSWAGNLRLRIWPPASVSGVVRDESGEPVVGVLVRALAKIRVAGRDDLAAGLLTVTDDHGRYRLAGLIPGRYIIQVPSVQMTALGGTRINAATTNVPEGAIDVDDTARLVIGRFPLPPPSVNGHVMSYAATFHPNGSRLSDAATLDLKFGDDRAGIDVALTPVAAFRVSGTVDGPPEAITTLTLRLLPAGMENLGLGAETATAQVGPNGSFTFVNVPPGSYVLDAPVTFNEFSMGSGATMTGGSVGMGSRGSLPAPPPRAGAGSSTQGIADVPGVGFTTKDFRGVYGDNVPNFTGRTQVTVFNTDVTGVVVHLRGSTTLRGKLILEPDPTKPAATSTPRFSIFMDPAAGQPALGQPRASQGAGGSQDFEIPGLLGGEYFLRAQNFQGWLVKSIQWRGRDYTTTPFDAAATDDLSGVTVTVTNAVPTLAGAVRASDGTVPESGLVIVFPVQPTLRTNTGLWSPRMIAVPLQSDGSFRSSALPAGDYFIAAIDRSSMATWRDPEFLALAERQATRVTLAWGQTVSRDLTQAVIR
jgi:hypothetical protein